MNTAVSETLPLLNGASQAATRSTLTDINRIIRSRLNTATTKGISSGDDVASDGNNFWLKPFGSRADQDDRSGAAGFDADVAGLALGIDGEIAQGTRLGVSFAYARADIDGNTNSGNDANVDIFQLTGYGSYDVSDDVQANFQIGVGKNRNEGYRALPSFGVVAKSDYDSLTATAGAGIGRTYTLSEGTRFTPSVRADYTWIKDDDYREKGAGALDLDVNGRTGDAFVVALDGNFSHDFAPGTTGSVNVGVGYDLANDRYALTSAYAGAPGAAFRTEGIDPSPVSLRGGAGLSHVVDSNTEVTLRYDVEHRTDFLSQTASLKVRWAF